MSFSTLEREITPQDQLLLLHIPKTGGVSLDSIIQQHFDLHTIAPPLYTPLLLHDQISADFFESYTYYRGHVYFDLMKTLIAGSMPCLTLLRDPIERFLSQFSHMQRLPDKFLKYHLGLTRQEVDDFETISLDEFVFDSEMVRKPNFQNYQTRLIGARFDFEEHPDSQLSLKSVELEPPPGFDLARKRLSEFTFVGLIERFQDSLFLLAYTFGWPPRLTPPWLNAAPTRPSQDRLAPNTLDKILEYNRLDGELYAYAQRLFEDRFNQMCHELLERYGQAAHAHLSLPLPAETVFHLLERHYRQRFKARHTPTKTISFTFDKAISGTGWHLPEAQTGQGTYRWTGPETRSILDFPLKIDEATHIKFSVVSAITPDTLNNLRLFVNGEPVSLMQYPEGNTIIFEGCLSPNDSSGEDRGCTRLEFQVDQTVQPCSLDSDNDDDRPVGIALNWLELKPVLDELTQRRAETAAISKKQKVLEQTSSDSKDFARSLEATLQNKEAEFASLSATLSARCDEITTLRTQLRQQKQAYRSLQDAHDQAGARGRSLEAALHDKEAELTSLTAALENKTAELVALSARLQQQKQSQEMLQGVYDEAKEYAHSLEATVQNKEAELSSLTSALDSKTDELADLRKQLQHQAEAHQKLQKVYNEARDYARALEKAIRDRHAELGELRQELQAIRESRAYKTGQQVKQLTKIFSSQGARESDND